ncbi:hypothetical protein GCM10027454_35860 [Algoriphagus aestuariicola]
MTLAKQDKASYLFLIKNILMRKTLLCFVLLTIFSLKSQAQVKGDARIHVLGSYGLEYNDFGIGGGVEYFFTDRFALMPSFFKVYPEVGNLSNFSFDLRYYVTEGPSQLYFMAGYSQNFQNTAPGQAGTRENFVGANAGIGAFVGLTDWVGLSTEFRVQTQYPQEAGFRIGFAFSL